MTSIGSVLSWQPDALGAVADALVADRRALVALQDEIDAGAPPPTWAAPARVMAVQLHRRLTVELADLVAGVAAAATATDDAAATIRAAQQELEGSLAWAARQGFTVDRGTGRVTDTLCTTDEDAADRRIQVAEIADRLEQAVLSAAYADEHLAEMLDRVAAGRLSAASDDLARAAAAGGADGALALRPLPAGGTAADASAWWESLSEQDQARVLDEHPEWLGSTDGIPAGIRDRANRALISVYRAELEAEAERLQANLDGRLLGGWFTDDDAALQVVREKLAGLDEIEKVLDQPERQLLVLDIHGARQLMAAVAVGDVDSADHVSVFTPGFTTTVAGSLANTDSSMWDLRETAQAEARKYGSGGTVATVAWLGYEAPQWDEWYDLGGRFVTSEESARAGAESLAGFYRGIDASRQADPHLTALGHSYGSTTTGLALQQATGVDGAVVFGSPGLGTSHVADLQVPQGQLFRIEARDDGVADAGTFGLFGIDPSHVDGIVGLSAKEATIGAETFEESTGHSQYLRTDTTSQHNIAAVVVGVPDRMVLDDGRGLGDLLSVPVPGTY